MLLSPRYNLDMAGVNHQPFIIRLIDQNFQEFFPNTFSTPTDEPLMNTAPFPVIGRGMPVRILITEGTRADCKEAVHLMKAFQQKLCWQTGVTSLWGHPVGGAERRYA